MIANNLNDNQITVNCGLSVGLLGKARQGKSDLGKKAIEKILIFYQNINRTWLLTGEGEMLKNDIPQLVEQSLTNDERSRFLSMLESQQRMLESQQRTIEQLTNK